MAGPPIQPKIEDKLTEHSWPKFLHPWPLSDKYFLVACKPEPDAPWGIYLVDIFDNLIPIMQTAEAALFEPGKGWSYADTNYVLAGFVVERVTGKGLFAAAKELVLGPGRVSKSDPRMARVLDEHPRLDRWRTWRLAETATVYVLVARRWFSRLLVVVNKETLELRRLATGGGLTSAWHDVAADQWELALKQ
mgnify:CR=1 FL=1